MKTIPPNDRIVSWTFVRDAFWDALRTRLGYSVHMMFGSAAYYLPDRDTLVEVFQRYLDVRPPYLVDVYDCNDFAAGLAAISAFQAYEDGVRRAKIPMGIVTGLLRPGIDVPGHAMNITMDATGQVYWVEPQLIIGDFVTGVWTAEEAPAENTLAVVGDIRVE